jgi:hypothetical protein
MALPHGSQPLLDRFHRRRLLKASGAITALAFLGPGRSAGLLTTTHRLKRNANG